MSSCVSSRNDAAIYYSEGGTVSLHTDVPPEWAMAASERLKAKREKGETLIQPELIPPKGTERVLLHSCCAPCSCAMVEQISMISGIKEIVVFFYNPNIHPKKEYEIRKRENKRFCMRSNIHFVDCDYDADQWYERMKGMEFEPERIGTRCIECFDMRMERTALYAYENGFDTILTSMGTSRWKDQSQINDSGYRAASWYNGVQYWCHDWQASDEMTIRKYEIAANEKFYKQEYCGCSYSLRDSNQYRISNGIPKIKIGGTRAGDGSLRYFTDPLVDAAEESQEIVDDFFQQAEKQLDITGRQKGNLNDW